MVTVNEGGDHAGGIHWFVSGSSSWATLVALSRGSGGGMIGWQVGGAQVVGGKGRAQVAACVWHSTLQHPWEPRPVSPCVPAQ